MEWVGRGVVGRAEHAQVGPLRVFAMSRSSTVSSRLLLLGYRGGIQAWDCTREQVREVLNLLSPTLGAVIGAAVIPAPAPSPDDSLAAERPLLGIL
jgi:hypothetical protein